MNEPLTPFQPTGPYPQVMLDVPTGMAIPLSADARGERVTIAGRLLDGAGQPVFDAMIETWQPDANGRFPHPADPRAADADPGFWGYRRVATDTNGRFHIDTVKPGSIRDPEGPVADLHAPHIVIGIYGGGILYRYVTRLYFADEPANASDQVMQQVPAERRATLIASRDGNVYRFDIRLQGERETVFFDV